MTARIGVLASGGGSNLQSLLDHLDRLGARRGGEVVLVASDRASAGALDRARRRAVEALVIDPVDGEALDAALRARDIDVVALAGYLRFVPPLVTRRLRGRIVNVHPALLPAFGGAGMYGLRVHQAVLDARSPMTGATVHFVDEALDHGPIIAQWPVAVQAGDTAQTLAARVLRIEHLLFPRAVDAVAAGRITLGADDRVHGVAPVATDTALAQSRESDDAIAAYLDALLGANHAPRLAARDPVSPKKTAKSR